MGKCKYCMNNGSETFELSQMVHREFHKWDKGLFSPFSPGDLYDNLKKGQILSTLSVLM